MRNLTTGLLILTCLAGPATAEQEPFLGSKGLIYPNPTVPGRYQSYASVQGDFNEDGIEDYVLMGSDLASQRVMLGLGECDFVSSSVGDWGIGSGSIGDFNEDGHQDLVLALEWGGIEVLLGNGDGTFATAVPYLVPGSFPGELGWSTAVADFDEDGHDDVLFGWAHNGNPFAFFSGNGDGTFDPAVTFGSGQAFAPGVADFNGDTHLDFVAGAGFGSSMMKVYLGTGTGAFTDGGSYPGGGDAWEYLIHDFNGDFALDVVAVNGSSSVSVLLGNGNGTFQPGVTYAAGDQPIAAVHGDFDSDGNEDLLVSSWSEPLLSLLTGNGDGTFNPEVQLPQVQPPGPILTSDLDDDGYLDVVLPGFGVAFMILHGLGDGTFDGPDPGFVASAGTPGAIGATFGELNGDGRRDAVVLRGLGNTATVRLADGTGAFNVTATLQLAGAPTDAAIADLNNDSNGDVLVSTNQLSVFLGLGDGTFGPALTSRQEAVAIATGVFNADTNVDLAAISTSAVGMLDIQLGNGNGTFTFGRSYPVGDDPVEVVTGDFNEDLVTDLAVLNDGTDDLSVLIGVGDGTFLPEVRYALVNPLAQPVLKIFDVNEDGDEDLAVSALNVFYGAGDGTFAAATTVLGSGGGSFAFADTNGDGRTDYVSPGSLVYLNLRLPDGSFDPNPQIFANASGVPLEIVVEDTNGDSRNDLVVAMGGGNQGDLRGVSVLLNVEQTPFNFGADKATMTWPSITGALSYNVYRGLISNLVDGDADGLPDAGYGACQNALDPDTTDTHYVDASPPLPGDGYFYLIAAVDWAGERYLGSTSDGLARFPGTTCP